MKRVLIALITTLPLALGVSVAQANTSNFPGFPTGTGTGSTPTGAIVGGTIVSVNASAGSFVADAYVITPPTTKTGTGGTSGSGFSFGGGTGGSGFSFGGSFGFGGLSGLGGILGFTTRHTTSSTTPTPTQVTITTNASTKFKVSGVTGTATIGDLVPGAKFLALFPGSASASITTLVGSPATSIFVQLPMQFYAFVGTVASTNPTAGTISVNVFLSLPSSVIAGGTTATFTVSSHTLVIGGSSLTSGGAGGLFGGLFGGSVTSVTKGDLVAGGLIGDAGLTATQVEASPLMFLLDLPAPTVTTTASTTISAEHKALAETVRVLHGAKLKLKKVHGKTSHTKKSHHKAKH